MIHKTQGIVLRQHKFSDSKRIVHIFTKHGGKKSFVVYNSSKKNNKKNFFQPLFVLNLEFLDKGNNRLLNFKEVSVLKPFSTIPFLIQKTSIVFFIAEVLNKVIEEDFVDEAFFDFIANALFVLDNQDKSANFHLAFLTAMSFFLGVMPEKNYSTQNKFFDLKNANFSRYYLKESTMDEVSSQKFIEILLGGIDNFHTVKLTQSERKIILSKLLDYYYYHFSVKNLKSVDVLMEVFS